jgi:hypothetical protein
VSEAIESQGEAADRDHERESAKPQTHCGRFDRRRDEEPANRHGRPNPSIQRFSSALSAEGVVTRRSSGTLDCVGDGDGGAHGFQAPSSGFGGEVQSQNTCRVNKVADGA